MPVHRIFSSLTLFHLFYINQTIAFFIFILYKYILHVQEEAYYIKCSLLPGHTVHFKMNLNPVLDTQGKRFVAFAATRSRNFSEEHFLRTLKRLHYHDYYYYCPLKIKKSILSAQLFTIKQITWPRSLDPFHIV